MEKKFFIKTICPIFRPIHFLAAGFLIITILLFPEHGLCSPPINDNFNDALTLAGNFGQVSGSNKDATGEQGEPNHANVYDLIATSSVWWKWEAPATGKVSFDTHGSNFDTVLGVYTGTDLISLTETGSSDDNGTTNYLSSTVTFDAQAGTLYYIALGGYQGDTGSFVLNMTFPAQAVGPDTWEDDNTFDKANVIFLNQKAAQRHNFYDPGDADWVKFYAVEAQLPYAVKTVNLSDSTNIVIELYDTDGKTLLKKADYYIEGQNEDLSWYCFKEGMYYVKISNYSQSAFGEDTAYELRVYIEVAALGIIQGSVTDSITGMFLKDVKIKSIGFSPGKSKDSGWYTIEALPDKVTTLSAELEGYKEYQAEILVEAGITIIHDIFLTSLTGTDKGDINQDGKIDLADAIIGLQIITGATGLAQKDYVLADVSTDSKIGLEEVIYILKDIAG